MNRCEKRYQRKMTKTNNVMRVEKHQNIQFEKTVDRGPRRLREPVLGDDIRASLQLRSNFKLKNKEKNMKPYVFLIFYSDTFD